MYSHSVPTFPLVGPVIVGGFWSLPFHILGWVLIALSFYLIFTAKKRMRHKFEENSPGKDRL